MPIPAEEAAPNRPMLVSLLWAVLFFANPVVLTLANLWDRVLGNIVATLMFLQFEGVYAFLSLAAGWAVCRMRPIVWLWLVPVILAAAVMGTQIAIGLWASPPSLTTPGQAP